MIGQPMPHYSGCRVVGSCTSTKIVRGETVFSVKDELIAYAGIKRCNFPAQVESVEIPGFNNGYIFRTLDTDMAPHFDQGVFIVCEKIDKDSWLKNHALYIIKHKEGYKIREYQTRGKNNWTYYQNGAQVAEKIETENILDLWLVREKLTLEVLQISK